MLPIKAVLLLGMTLVLGTVLSGVAVSQTLRDPTRPAVVFKADKEALAKNTGDARLVLNSITWNGKQAFVVINNKIYHRGDSVQGVRISQIRRDQVILGDGRKLLLFSSVTEK
ncbi:MAG: general secretion pathway protein GspB [Shewanella sp.]|nr:general secretion pathway protein GspB [Shewanella sp.]MCF1429489.1 general secretion pathway protein GspB [Shewanella sp.]MCF1457672.1 general secretion pathway protein GspB [Shewanella sp.]